MKPVEIIAAKLRVGEEWLFANPKTVLGLILAFTIFWGFFVPRLKIFTDFNDLLPANHEYIKTYNEIKKNFGGANLVVLAIEVDHGTIFNPETLALIHKATLGIDELPNVNHDSVKSLTHYTVRKTEVDTMGGFKSIRYYDPQNPPRSPQELEKIRKDVLASPDVYGLLVSTDLKAALVKVQLFDQNLNYQALFEKLNALRGSLQTPGHKVWVTGNPVLTGWVYTYIGQIITILLWTLGILVALLIAYFRRLYGIMLPLVGIALSSIWGLGFMGLTGINLEPLSLPIPFLIAARATSHGVQLVARYYEELSITKNASRAARNALEALFRPGSLAIIIDALGIAAIVIGAAPFNHKLGMSAGFWGLSVIFTVHFMVPLALSVLPQPKSTEITNPNVRILLGRFMSVTGGTDGGARTILVLCAIGLLGAFPILSQIKIGESEPGSALLHRDHDYNVSSKRINELFPGSDELVILVQTQEEKGIQNPRTMLAIEKFTRHMLDMPATAASKHIGMVVRNVNALLHNQDPIWAQMPNDTVEIGSLMYTYMTSSPIPGALNEYLTPDNRTAALVFYYKDHQADTVKNALDWAKAGIKELKKEFPGVEFKLAGGLVGVNAAINESLHDDHVKVVPLVMLIAFALVAVYYSSLHAGWLMIMPMLFSTALSYAYMSAKGISISVATVPVVAVGVGVGIDYAVYFMDRIREEMAKLHDIKKAVVQAVATTGYAVSFTAATLVCGVILWVFMSDLRFQADTAELLIFMLVVNAIAAMLLVPAWCVVFKPKFVTEVHMTKEGVIEEDA